MSDKIYRRDTHPSCKSKSVVKKNEKNRKRNMILNFRVTPEEKELIETRIRLSGLSKETFFIESCLYQAIFVKGNVKSFDAIRKSIETIKEQFMKMDFQENPDKQILIELRIILELLEKIFHKGE